MSGVVVLGADVGGTHTKLAIASTSTGAVAPIERRVYPSGDYASLEKVVEAFLALDVVAPHARAMGAACFAVAGPVEEGRARLTNLPWALDEAALAAHFGLPHVRIVNDFAAVGLGIPHLGGGDLLTLQAGRPVEDGTRVVVGAGTGLGVAMLDWDGQESEIHPSEAGHCDFAPMDSVQDALLGHLRARHGHVSCERVLSGAGLVGIARFLVETGGEGATGALREALETPHAARSITELALSREDALAVQALDIFAASYGAFAGNMALATLAHGGVYVAGGIAPKIAAKLSDGTFMRAFTAKGRFQSLLEEIPVHVVMNDQVGLLGALAGAVRLTRD